MLSWCFIEIRLTALPADGCYRNWRRDCKTEESHFERRGGWFKKIIAPFEIFIHAPGLARIDGGLRRCSENGRPAVPEGGVTVVVFLRSSRSRG